MKKDIVMYKSGSFVDFQGVERQFVVCALSTSNFNNDDQQVCLSVYDDIESIVLGEHVLPRAVFIGISVCNPSDKWDEEKGKFVAYHKAAGFKATAPEKSAALFATRAGMINEAVVQALLDREVEHLKEDPGYVIKGYNQMKAKYERNQEAQKYLEETSPELLELGSKLAALDEEGIARVLNVAVIRSDE